MNANSEWWSGPRRVSVVVDNDSWILPYAQQLVEAINKTNDNAQLCRDFDAILAGDVAFYIGCMKITPDEVLNRNKRNLVVHESDLPKGRGFSPLSWQILEGCNAIPICLLDMVEDVDAGPIVFKDYMNFDGHELFDELKAAQGQKTIELCLRFLSQPSEPIGTPQTGDSSFYKRRTPIDSELDPNRTLADQFEQLRIVDNENYPAFFSHRGEEYVLTVRKRSEKTKD